MEYLYETTWLKGMNTRPEHSVNNPPNGTIAYRETVRGVELWEAPADGLNVRKGDLWMRLDTVIVRWVAVVHMGIVYGVVEEVGTPPPPPVSQFPEYFMLTDPEGNTRRYVLSEG